MSFQIRMIFNGWDGMGWDEMGWDELQKRHRCFFAMTVAT